MHSPSAKNGFTVIEVVLVIVTLLSLSAATYFAYQLHAKKPAVPTVKTSARIPYPVSGQASQSDTQAAQLRDQAIADASDCSSILAASYIDKGETLDSLSMDMQTINTHKANATTTTPWTTLPQVFNANCKTLPFTDLKAGQLLNLYFAYQDGRLTGVQIILN